MTKKMADLGESNVPAGGELINDPRLLLIGAIEEKLHGYMMEGLASAKLHKVLCRTRKNRTYQTNHI